MGLIMFRVSILLVSAFLLLSVSAQDADFGSVPPPCSPCTDDDRHSDCQALTFKGAQSDSFNLAFALKRCLNLPLESELRATLKHLTTTLSESERNVVFHNEVCIVNKRFNEYLYSPANDFIYRNTPRRRIFTWIPGAWNHNHRGDWKLIKHGDNEYFIVSVENGEYITANNDVTENRRQVTTTKVSALWLAENRRQALWSLQSSDAYLYIKNVQYNEHLYAVDGRNHDDERRSVSAWSKNDNGCSGDDQCLWKIVPC